jgi:lipase maturation factor 1
MTVYYETAPLPTWLGYYAHNLPAWWHHFESHATLVLELGLPLGIFGPRRARLLAAAGFTAFQVVNFATANYGFFCTLATVLHVFLLDDTDVARLRRLIRLGPAPAPTPAPPRVGASFAAAGLYVALSLAQALFAFGPDEPGAVLRAIAAPVDHLDAFRLVNTYHLFASITRERIEPELQTLDAGRDAADDTAWVAHDLWYKPGDPRRAPDFVAPHQPRLDFQLWFHGLSFQRGRPAYLQVLLERMCEDVDPVRPFFRDPLPPHPRAVRVVYWQYRFTTPAEKRATGAWWRRERVGVAAPVICPSAP